MTPFISICIPAYKRVSYLERLLNSLIIQTFKNFEVIVTDDSDDDSVKKLTDFYVNRLNLIYYKNPQTLGTPANWNTGIAMAKGEWIKLMHDDDWFKDDKSLNIFAENTRYNKKFIFSAYTNIYLSSIPKKITASSFWKRKIIISPETIFAFNVIGPPSVTMVHKSLNLQYDERLKWRVDQDFYIRVLRTEKTFTYISHPLINIGVSETQVTRSSINNPTIELPEGFIMLQKFGTKPLKNILIYDTWWRLLRNMKIDSERNLLKHSNNKWPKIIIRIIKDQSSLPRNIIRLGVFSKLLMTLSFLKNRSSI